VTQSQNQLSVIGDVSMPLLALSQWASVTQSRDQVEVTTRQAADARTQIASATGRAYLAVIAAHRQIDVNERALESSRAHLDYATKRLEGGAGSRLNQMRAAREVSAEEVQLEVARLLLMRAQEALGVLMAENGPVDSISEPVFEIPQNVAESEWMNARPDVRAQQSVIAATDRVLRDSWRDWTPTAHVAFAPQYVTPSSLFLPSGSWRLLLSFTQPIYEGGQKRATKALRGIALDQTRLQLSSVEIEARSQVRTAQQEVDGRLRAMASAQRAASQAIEVLRITTSAYELGATTNIEVIDAQREARDAEAAAVLAEDGVRIARLDLLVALGRFPR
jgi:outer membrane protein TolC